MKRPTTRYASAPLAQGLPLMAAVFLAVSGGSLADTSEPRIPEDLDISSWECSYCTFEEGWRGFVEIGLIGLSDQSDKFGEYNGLYEDGPYIIANALSNYRDKTGKYLDVTARDLGLDTQEFNLEGGKQGRYSLSLHYDEITHFIASELATPYYGFGSNELTLPADWTKVGQSSEVLATLNTLDLKTQRKKFDIEALFIPARHWETSINLSHEVRNGQKRGSGAFYFNAVELANPVDYVTDEIELSATYTRRQWQSRLTYFGSSFKNDHRALTWDNAYNPIVGGADSGQLAQAPDNQFHQLQASTGYQWGRTRLFGSISAGEMSQDVDLLMPTVNQQLAVALPNQSANAKVSTLNGNLRIHSLITPKTQLKFSYYLNDRNNKTESQLYQWISTDSFINPVARRNLPYSYSTEKTELEGIFRIDRNVKASLGYELTEQDRTHQEVDNTKEDSYWAGLRIRASNIVDLHFKFASSDRDASGYHPVADIAPQNPLMRKYNMADRNRNKGSASASFFLHERITLDLSVDANRDHYQESYIGLTEAKSIAENADIAVVFNDKVTSHFYTSYEKISSKQTGSEHFATADWFAQNKDKINTYGAGVTYKLIEDKLDFEANIVRSLSKGDIKIDTYLPGTPFPEVSSDFTNIYAQADYLISQNFSLSLVYAYEKYKSKDWARDAIQVNTIANLISLGYNPQDYDIHSLMVSAKYLF